MNVQFIEKIGEGKKDFSTINDGDVVILPAFGASFEEMDMFDKKVRTKEGVCVCVRRLRFRAHTTAAITYICL
jgi:4-hydroxy-3-methylbut-2-enyl diphosphate reductase